MNAGDRNPEWLSAYLDGELDDEQRAAVEAWLRDDAAARAKLDELRQTVEAVAALPRRAAPADLAARVAANLERKALLDTAAPIGGAQGDGPATLLQRLAYAAILLITAGVGYIAVYNPGRPSANLESPLVAMDPHAPNNGLRSMALEQEQALADKQEVQSEATPAEGNDAAYKAKAASTELMRDNAEAGALAMRQSTEIAREGSLESRGYISDSGATEMPGNKGARVDSKPPVPGAQSKSGPAASAMEDMPPPAAAAAEPPSRTGHMRGALETGTPPIAERNRTTAGLVESTTEPVLVLNVSSRAEYDRVIGNLQQRSDETLKKLAANEIADADEIPQNVNIRFASVLKPDAKFDEAETEDKDMTGNVDHSVKDLTILAEGNDREVTNFVSDLALAEAARGTEIGFEVYNRVRQLSAADDIAAAKEQESDHESALQDFRGRRGSRGGSKDRDATQLGANDGTVRELRDHADPEDRRESDESDESPTAKPAGGRVDADGNRAGGSNGRKAPGEDSKQAAEDSAKPMKAATQPNDQDLADDATMAQRPDGDVTAGPASPNAPAGLPPAGRRLWDDARSAAVVESLQELMAKLNRDATATSPAGTPPLRWRIVVKYTPPQAGVAGSPPAASKPTPHE